MFASRKLDDCKPLTSAPGCAPVGDWLRASWPPHKVILRPCAVRMLNAKFHRAQVVPHLLFRPELLVDRLVQVHGSIAPFRSRPPFIFLNH